jgi:pSer/pThr/pTyr-binding forkhead associated (FHA) protein
MFHHVGSKDGIKTMGNALKFKHKEVTRQPDEKARLKVVQGPDFGAIYVIRGMTVSIGRGEENDIVLTDLKASRLHATLLQNSKGKWRIKDQGSSNGILFKTKTVREADLNFNDVFTIGETTLEFVSAEMGTKILTAPARSSESINAEAKAFQIARDRIWQRFGYFSKRDGDKPGHRNHERAPLSLPPSSGGSIPSVAGARINKKTLIYIGAAGILGLLFLIPSEKGSKTTKKAKETDAGSDLASFLPPADINKSSETLYKDGVREYFVHNYGRARTQLETVLQISPNHILARMYLENCNKAIDEEVKLNLGNGKRSLEGGKLREAKGHFERVMRLLFRDQKNPNYIEAEKQFKEVMKEMKGEDGKT